VIAFEWSWELFRSSLPDLLDALWLTVQVTVLASLVALVVGWLWVAGTRPASRTVRWSVRGMLEFLRDTPPIVHLLVVFYAFPSFGLSWSGFVVGVVVLGVHYSTFVAEIYRGGLAGIPQGQWEAARVMGLSTARTWRSVVIPQVLREALPSLGNTVLALFKETSLLVAISVPVLMTVAQRTGTASFRYFEPLTAAALLYLTITLPFGLLLRRLESRYAHRRH
jgi:polar amino acid transport system permease protein